MQLLNIGPLELLLILVIAIVVLGPKGMVNGARELGKAIRKLVKSPIWSEIVDTSREIREFPRKIVREAGIEKEIEDLRRSTRAAIPEFDRSHLRENITPLEQPEDTDDQNGGPADKKIT